MARETRAIWAKRVRRWKRSGLRATAFAAREGVNTKTLWWWNWRLACEPSAEPPPAFVEVATRETASAPISIARPVLEVVVREGTRVAVPVGFDADTLRRVLSVVEGG